MNAGRSRPRRELYANTLASSAWAQGTLIASVVALPLLTRFLTKAEFGLWAQLLSLSVLTTVADFGMSAVFLRRLTASRASEPSLLRAATRFYVFSGATVAVVLSAICFVPGGLLAPFAADTQLPGVAAGAIIAAMVVNLSVQPYTVRLLAQGRMDLESIFGAGPAVVGSLVTIPAAYLFHSAVAVGIAYAGTEIAFDIGLILLVRGSATFVSSRSDGARSAPTYWRPMLAESWGLLVISLAPQMTPALDATIVGHVKSAVFVAYFFLALRVSDLVRRFFNPFANSLFVSLCRTTGTTRKTVVHHAAALPWVILVAGLAIGAIVATAGRAALSLAFGSGYGHAERALVILLVAATIRAMYMPAIRRLQADEALGSIPRWFVIGFAAHVILAIGLTSIWSIEGTAAAVLLGAVLFELLPVTLAMSRHERSESARVDPRLQMAAGLAGGLVLLLLAWWRIRLGGWTVVALGATAIALSVIAATQLVAYLRSSRAVITGK